MAGTRTIGRAAAHSASAVATALGTRSSARSGACAASEDNPQPLGVPGTWTLVWSAFTGGENTLDAASFNVAGSVDDDGITFDYGVQTWDPSLVVVSDGVLTCTMAPDTPKPRAGGVSTKGKVFFSDGFGQCEMQVTGSGDAWPSVWSITPTPPKIEEIDWLESKGWVPAPTDLIHNVITSYTPKVEDPADAFSGTAWVTIGVLVKAGVVKFYVNGSLSHTSLLSFAALDAAHFMLADIASFGGLTTSAGTIKVRKWRKWTGTPAP